MKSSVLAPGWLLIFTELLRETSLPFTYFIIESPIIKTSFFTTELFADCRLIKLLSWLSLCAVVLLFFLWKVVCILGLSLVLVLTPWLLEWLSVTSVFTPLPTLDWLFWITRQDWWLSKFELCSSKKSIKKYAR